MHRERSRQPHKIEPLCPRSEALVQHGRLVRIGRFDCQIHLIGRIHKKSAKWSVAITQGELARRICPLFPQSEHSEIKQLCESVAKSCPVCRKHARPSFRPKRASHQKLPCSGTRRRGGAGWSALSSSPLRSQRRACTRRAGRGAPAPVANRRLRTRRC